MTRSLLAALLLALSTSALAQGTVPTVGITGIVEPLGPSICVPTGTHGLACSDVQLQSSVIDLDALVGRNVKLLGDQLPVVGCPIIDVQAVLDPPPASLETCGTPAVGCPVRFVVCPPGLSQYWLFLSFGNDFVPLGPVKGSWLLGSPFFLLSSGFLDIACARVDVVIPNQASLIGLDVFVQAARKPFGTGDPAQLTNSVCFTIMPPVVPCQQPGC